MFVCVTPGFFLSLGFVCNGLKKDKADPSYHFLQSNPLQICLRGERLASSGWIKNAFLAEDHLEIPALISRRELSRVRLSKTVAWFLFDSHLSYSQF